MQNEAETIGKFLLKKLYDGEIRIMSVIGDDSMYVDFECVQGKLYQRSEHGVEIVEPNNFMEPFKKWFAKQYTERSYNPFCIHYYPGAKRSPVLQCLMTGNNMIRPERWGGIISFEGLWNTKKEQWDKELLEIAGKVDLETLFQ